MMGSAPAALPIPNANAEPAQGAGAMQAAHGHAPRPPQSSPLPRMVSRSKQPSLGLLVGVAVAFLVVGATLAAVVMKLVMK